MQRTDYCNSSAALFSSEPKLQARRSSLSVLLRFLQHDLTSGFIVILLCGEAVDEQVTLNCLLYIPILLTVWQTLAQPPSSSRWGCTSLFVFLHAAHLHCKHRCCIIHSRSEAAVSDDCQVMWTREPHRKLEDKSWTTQRLQPFPKESCLEAWLL